MKRFFLLAALLLLAGRVLAQEQSDFKLHYEGDAAFGITYGGGDAKGIFVETVHGVRILPYLFAGAGLGIDYFPNVELPTVNDKGKIVTEKKDRVIYLPIFANVKGIYPVSDKFAIYFSADLGAVVGICDVSGAKDFYTALGPGIQLGRKSAFDFSVRYQHMGEGSSAVMARIGIRF